MYRSGFGQALPLAAIASPPRSQKASSLGPFGFPLLATRLRSSVQVALSQDGVRQLLCPAGFGRIRLLQPRSSADASYVKERRWNALTIGLGSAAMIAALGMAAVYGAVLRRIATNAFGATGDFLPFYSAGYMVRTGQVSSLYDPATLELVQRQLYPGSFDEALGYTLPVFVAWAFAPVSLLPFTASFFLFMGALGTLLAAITYTFRQYLADVPQLPRSVFLGCAAFGMPTIASIVFGQVDLIVLSGLTAGYLLLQNGRPRAAGLALCLMLVKPHMLFGVGLLLLMRREWRTVSTLAVVGIPLLVLPPLLSAPDALIDNVKILASYPGADKELAVNATVMPNWRGFMLSATNGTNMLLWLPGHAVIAVGVVIAAYASWRRHRDLDRTYAIAAILPIIVSPHLHTQSLVLLLLPAAILLRAYFRAGRSTAREMPAVNALLFVYASAFFLSITAIQGLSLGIFPVLALYLVVLRRWPESDEGALTARTPAHKPGARRMRRLADKSYA